MRTFGTFFRLESSTQTVSVAAKQVASGEIWGKTPRGGLEPTVQAYAGSRGGCRGVEFSTDIEPHNNGTPLDARWYLTLTAGVVARYCQAGEEHASIEAEIDNFQV